MTFLLHNTFDGGIDGQAITTGNSGGTSGDPFTFVDGGWVWDGTEDVQLLPTYSSTHTAHGGLSAQFPTDTWGLLSWDDEEQFLPDGDKWLRFYLRVDLLDDPDAYNESTVSMYAAGSDDAENFLSVHWYVRASYSVNEEYPTTGYLGYQATDDDQGWVYDGIDFPVPPPLSQLIRIEAMIPHAASGTAQVRVFNDPHSTVPDMTSTIDFAGHPVVPWVEVDIESGGWQSRSWVDEVAISGTGWIGPVGATPPSTPPFRGWGVPIGSAA